jgi:hypothetical protein
METICYCSYCFHKGRERSFEELDARPGIIHLQKLGWRQYAKCLRKVDLYLADYILLFTQHKQILFCPPPQSQVVLEKNS